MSAAAKLEAGLYETLLWTLVRDAAIAGLPILIGIEERGIEIDRRLGVDTAPREKRLEQLRDAHEMVKDWKAHMDVPRRK